VIDYFMEAAIAIRDQHELRAIEAEMDELQLELRLARSNSANPSKIADLARRHALAANEFERLGRQMLRLESDFMATPDHKARGGMDIDEMGVGELRASFSDFID